MCILLGLGIVLITAPSTGAETLVFEGPLSTAEIAPYISYFTDTDSTHDVHSAATQRFLTNQDLSVNLGSATGHVWMRLVLFNGSKNADNWILSFNRALLEDLEVYARSAHGQEFTQIFDVHTPRTEEQVLRRYGTLATSLGLAPGELRELLIRFKGYNSNALPVSVEAESELTRKRDREVAFFLIVAAGVLTFVLYNTLVHGFTGDRPFLYYSVAQLALLAYFGHIEGVTTAYLWPGHTSFGAALSPVLGGVISITIVAFTRSFIVGQPHSRLWDHLLNAALCLSVVALVCAVSGAVIGIPSNTLVLGVVYLTSFIVWILLPVLACTATILWQTWHWPLIPAWSAMSGFTFYTAAVFAGIVPINDWHPYLYGLASYCEAGFLALAMALRLRHQRQQHLDTQEALNQSLQRELLTARKTAQLAESRAIVLAELGQREHLLRAASHDSRQLVATLKQTAYALDHGANNAQVKNVLEHAAEYLDAVLTTTAGGAFTGGFDDDVIALDTVNAQELLEPLRLLFEQSASEKNIGLVLCAEQFELATDRALIMRMLANLVNNAIKYTHFGSIEIVAHEGGDTVVLEVRDTGKGMLPEQAEALLSEQTPAVRFEETDNGSGTGWKIIRELAVRLQGVLSIQSTPGEGTKVTVAIPQGYDTLRSVAVPIAEIHELDLDNAPGGEVLAEAGELAQRGACVAVTTHDHSLDLRRKVGKITPYILYKPVTSLARGTLQRLLA